MRLICVLGCLCLLIKYMVLVYLCVFSGRLVPINGAVFLFLALYFCDLSVALCTSSPLPPTWFMATISEVSAVLSVRNTHPGPSDIFSI